jgi:hypothetical protein
METVSVEPPAAGSVEETLRQGVRSFQSNDWPGALTHFFELDAQFIGLQKEMAAEDSRARLAPRAAAVLW